ncbi:MAG: pilus assembly protein PilM [Lachnospiraceae bacterium]|nr:pilus assembly protein PilM [Lachnospiraceae bacterium]
MAKNKNTIGLCCQHGRLAIAYRDNKGVMRSVWEDVPENMINGHEIVSKNLFGELIKDTLAKNNIKAREVAYVISGEDVFVRNITIPRMEHQQILENIPFEFRDYISGELKEYLFDYAYIPPTDKDKADEDKINVIAVATRRKEIEDVKEIMGHASLKLVKVAPDFCAFEKLLAQIPIPEERMKERGFIDIGRNTTRLFIFKNGRYKLLHMVHVGGSRVIETIADTMNVDLELAKTYMYKDYENCTSLQECMNVYKDISVEILKGLNFYEMSDMSSRLGDVVLCGVGATLMPLCDLLKERITMNVSTIGEIFTSLDHDKCLGISGTAVGIIL